MQKLNLHSLAKSLRGICTSPEHVMERFCCPVCKGPQISHCLIGDPQIPYVFFFFFWSTKYIIFAVRMRGNLSHWTCCPNLSTLQKFWHCKVLVNLNINVYIKINIIVIIQNFAILSFCTYCKVLLQPAVFTATFHIIRTLSLSKAFVHFILHNKAFYSFKIRNWSHRKIEFIWLCFRRKINAWRKKWLHRMITGLLL